MAVIVLEKATDQMLRPVDGKSIEIVAGWRLGQGVRVEAKRMRNLQHHKKFMALVQFVAENSDVYDTRAKAMRAIKIAAGHVDWCRNPITGEMEAEPKSISFANMDQDEFALFYNDAVNGVLKWILPQMNRISIERAVETVAYF